MSSSHSRRAHPLAAVPGCCGPDNPKNTVWAKRKYDQEKTKPLFAHSHCSARSTAIPVLSLHLVLSNNSVKNHWIISACRTVCVQQFLLFIFPPLPALAPTYGHGASRHRTMLALALCWLLESGKKEQK